VRRREIGYAATRDRMCDDERQDVRDREIGCAEQRDRIWRITGQNGTYRSKRLMRDSV